MWIFVLYFLYLIFLNSSFYCILGGFFFFLLILFWRSIILDDDCLIQTHKEVFRMFIDLKYGTRWFFTEGIYLLTGEANQKVILLLMLVYVLDHFGARFRNCLSVDSGFTTQLLDDDTLLLQWRWHHVHNCCLRKA